LGGAGGAPGDAEPSRAVGHLGLAHSLALHVLDARALVRGAQQRALIQVPRRVVKALYYGDINRVYCYTHGPHARQKQPRAL
tara:strand:+ start:953 stop:1198 length:246 start_codon:yes stop_codon:yes gene_type:complete